MRRLLLDFHMMENCVYENAYALSSRPTWLPIPLRGLLALIGEPRQPRVTRRDGAPQA